jgi:ABC-type iron transport system FetAB ATPase subunit
VCPVPERAEGETTTLVVEAPGDVGKHTNEEGLPEVHHASEINGNGAKNADQPPVQLSYKDIRFAVDVKRSKEQGGGVEKRQILRGCSGVFQPGRLTAVLGASGAGKTSLLNVISGNRTEGKSSGTVRLNSQEVSLDDMARVRELSAYIQQDDILFGSQTVREAVTLSARLRLPKSMSDEEKLERVERVINVLGLTKCADTVIGDAFNKGISGGEKVRKQCNGSGPLLLLLRTSCTSSIVPEAHCCLCFVRRSLYAASRVDGAGAHQIAGRAIPRRTYERPFSTHDRTAGIRQPALLFARTPALLDQHAACILTRDRFCFSDRMCCVLAGFGHVHCLLDCEPAARGGARAGKDGGQWGTQDHSAQRRLTCGLHPSCLLAFDSPGPH